MKKKNWIYQLIVIEFALICTYSCKKNDYNDQNSAEPILTTSSVSNIKGTSATCGGNVTSDEGSSVSARGVC
jgi:hypothetical protein